MRATSCLLGLALLHQAMGLGGMWKDMLGCPLKLVKCLMSNDCRQTFMCGGECVVGTAMNLTCFVACTSGLDQSLFFDYTICSYNNKDPKPTDSGMIDVPMGGVCPDPSALIDSSFGIEDLAGDWYLVAGASDLETFDCQKNRFSPLNDTHWIVDEYYQGNITNVGFRQVQGSQIVRQTGVGTCAWQSPKGGSGGYQATYSILAHVPDRYTISFYCAPLTPSPAAWSSLVAYARTPVLDPEVEQMMVGYMAALHWDGPLVRVNHEGCSYRLPDPAGKTDKAERGGPGKAEGVGSPFSGGAGPGWLQATER